MAKNLKKDAGTHLGTHTHIHINESLLYTTKHNTVNQPHVNKRSQKKKPARTMYGITIPQVFFQAFSLS